MKKIDLGQIITLLANVGVIAGIVFLAVEIRQSNRLAVASTEIDVRSMYSSINESLYTDSGFAEIMIKSSDSEANLTAVEQLKFYSFILRLMNTWQSVEAAFENGMVPPETYGIIEDDIQRFLALYPATLPIWRQVVDDYSALASSDVYQSVRRSLEAY